MHDTILREGGCCGDANEVPHEERAEVDLIDELLDDSVSYKYQAIEDRKLRILRKFHLLLGILGVVAENAHIIVIRWGRPFFLDDDWQVMATTTNLYIFFNVSWIIVLLWMLSVQASATSGQQPTYISDTCSKPLVALLPQVKNQDADAAIKRASSAPKPCRIFNTMILDTADSMQEDEQGSQRDSIIKARVPPTPCELFVVPLSLSFPRKPECESPVHASAMWRKMTATANTSRPCRRKDYVSRHVGD